MVVYGEYLFIENFITGLIITYITGQLCGVCNKKSGKSFLSKLRARYLIVGILCGGYSFVLFVKMSAPIAFLSKLAFAIIVVFIAYNPLSIRIALKEALAFVIVSFLMGGITIGLLYLFQGSGITQNTSIYLEGVTYINVTLGASLTLLVGVWIKRFFAEKNLRQLEYDVLVKCGDKDYSLKGYVDSGNQLLDPFSKRPVTILSKKAMNRILHENEVAKEKARLIPFQSIGGAGLLNAYEVDSISIENALEKVEISRPLVAMYEKEFRPLGCYEYDVLLSQDVLNCIKE